MFSTPKRKGDLFLASSLRDGLEDRDLKQVTILLEKQGADPNILLLTHGITPFHLAVGNESQKFAEDVTRLFLEYGGDPNIESEDGMTPVHVAAAWGRSKILELLLANGGDPLCLDDDGRSPFHHAFDGSHYDAIAVLGKYCQHAQEDESEDEDVKVQIKLEKILVNRGDVIAEYVPSDIDLTGDNNVFEEESKNDICKSEHDYVENKTPVSKSQWTIGKHETSSSGIQDTNSEGGRANSMSEECNSSSGDDDSHLNINSNNVTLRRHQNHLQNKSTPTEKLNKKSEKKCLNSPKPLTDKIHNKLSSEINPKKNLLIQSPNINTKLKEFCSLLPQPKFFKNNLEFNNDNSSSGILDTSIVSKSPNFNIVNLKKKRVGTPQTNLYKSIKNFSPKNLYANSLSSSKNEDVDKNDSSSTPIKMTFTRPNAQAQYSIVNEQFSTENIKKEVDENFESSVEQSTQNESGNTEEMKSESLDLFNKNIDSKDDIETFQTNTMSEIEACNNGSSMDSNLLKFSQLFMTSNPEFKKKEENELDSSHGVKLNDVLRRYVSRTMIHSYDTSAFNTFDWSDKEEMSMWLDEDRCYKEKGPTPPASVSGFLDDPRNTFLINPYEGVDDTMAKQWNILNPKEAKILPNDFDDFRESNKLTDPRCVAETSFFSLDEEYAYVDKEKKVAFRERRLRVLPPSKSDLLDMAMDDSSWLDHYGNSLLGSNKSEPKLSLNFDKMSIDDLTLRQRLIELGEAPGPITHTTKYVYLKRLCKLERTLEQFDQLNINETEKTKGSNEKSESSARRQIPIELKSYDFADNRQFYCDLENEAFAEFDLPDSKRKYRGGIAKSSFNYLLLDPRITKDLPRNIATMIPADCWERFLGGIFYVGKGKAARPAAHLYDAFKIWMSNKKVDVPSKKIQRIIDIWKSGKGVVCLHVFMNTMQEEAFTREAAMIDALGTNYLSNCNRGNYYGTFSKRKSSEKKALGKFLLYKSMKIFMHEGERQLFPKSVE